MLAAIPRHATGTTPPQEWWSSLASLSSVSVLVSDGVPLESPGSSPDSPGVVVTVAGVESSPVPPLWLWSWVEIDKLVEPLKLCSVGPGPPCDVSCESLQLASDSVDGEHAAQIVSKI